MRIDQNNFASPLAAPFLAALVAYGISQARDWISDASATYATDMATPDA